MEKLKAPDDLVGYYTTEQMGLVQSNACVNLAMLPPEVWEELQNEDFTVQRNSKEEGGPKAGQRGCAEESGWRIQQKAHSACCGGYKAGIGPTHSEELGDAVATKYAKGQGDVWRVFMHKGWHSRQMHEHACGWRVCDPSRRGFWPTRCKTPLEKEVWWRWFDAQLESLPLWSDVLARRMHVEQTLPSIKERLAASVV